jgi:DnaD/phage-associated family protein
MARPIKEGLEYFPLDCDIDQDDKIALIEAQHGVIGFGIVIKLLMKIYKNSYYYEWTEKEQLLFSKRVNVDINEINVIINDLIKWKFFDEDMLNNEKILTSSGIQKRYLAAVGRRQKVQMLKKYLLLDEETINVYKNLVIADINPNLEIVNVDISTQSKVKESKVKESKVNNNNSSLLSLYETLGFGTINPVTLADVELLEKDYTEVWVQEALKEANSNGKRNLKYVKGILKNWKTNGFKAERPKQNYGKKEPGTGFNNFKAREYDYDDLEKKLLGWEND